MLKKLAYSLLPTFPVLLLAFSTGPPIMRTGAPVDGGQNCTACHRTFVTANSDPAGSVAIEAGSYTPGAKQTIKVTVKHPQAARWGFQLTARLVSDETKEAGTFAPNDVVRVRCNSTPAHDAPCDGAQEFAEHSNAPTTQAGAGFTFEMDWTPPATDSGDVVFYVAGNAANGDGTNGGDRIYTTAKTVTPANCALTGKPTIAGMLNGASFQSMMTSNAMVTIFGQNFAPAGSRRQLISGDIANNALPKQLACVAVEIDGKRAPISFVRPDQINVQAPATAAGPVTVKVILNPDRNNQSASDAATAQMSALSPAFFTFNGKSIAARVAGSADIVADPGVVPGGKFAKPGDIIELFGTGFGPTNPSVQAGDVATAMAQITGTPMITIGGVMLAPADVLYAGLSVGSVSGLYQFNVKVPATIPDGDAAVSIQIGSARTQDGATIPIRK